MSKAVATRHIAVDLGASSGRVALGTLEGGRLHVEILHRFPNGGVPVRGQLYWNVLGLWREVLHGLKLAAQHGEIQSIGVNSWAVDYGLLDAQGDLLGAVHHYRSPRLDGVMQRVRAKLTDEAIYNATGIQFLPFNTLYQLAAEPSERLARADKLLMIPDLLHFWLCGVAVTERTNASSTQFFNPQTGKWATELLDALNIPTEFLPAIAQSGTTLGLLTPEVERETGLKGVQVILPATHDTASAVAAVPAEGRDWAYVSSGTWSLVGIETPQPIITPRSLAENLTNEAGVGGTNRLLKNVMGLWIIQQCNEVWKLDYADLYEQAAAVASCSTIDPDDARFLPPGADMAARVQAYCSETNQSVPQTPAEITRCVLDSLAHKTAQILKALEDVSGQAIRVVHVVGGGSQIALLNQLIANACGKWVIAGPVEATLMGNLLVQALGQTDLPTLRQVVRASTALQTFSPNPQP
ncbi:rhamnulokinase [Deinococcus psychrotolerans]|uniref:Rhamnulokinase n=1 Tax=Deinococcus psychrotolerans TaxID=2489213 RepID=A0A3G8YMA5_9DEIO|nr:rhamnulokinase family protein [Deinococcus psychrotolerans]AZI42711.1 rhamnulokinase [Deinococcus psychrotolerans]